MLDVPSLSGPHAICRYNPCEIKAAIAIRHGYICTLPSDGCTRRRLNTLDDSYPVLDLRDGDSDCLCREVKPITENSPMAKPKNLFMYPPLIFGEI